MKLRPVYLTFAIILSAPAMRAQEVRVEVVEAANGRPISGANVSLLVDTLTSIGGGFSDSSGHAVLRAPVTGRYRLRADKAGYETWMSVVLQVTPTPIHVRIGMAPSRTPTPTIVRTETGCQQLNSGTPAGDLWVEMRKALAAASLTETQGLVPLDVDLYERVLDRNGAVVSEKTDSRSRLARRPVMGIAAEALDTTRKGESGAETVYRAPEIATFLSDAFVKSHCFAAIRGYGAETGLAGLEFKPSRVGTGPELAGVVWIDPAHSALKALAYDYVNLPIPLRIARTTGRLDFEQLPNGQWIVPNWFIRMPRVAQITSTDPNSPSVVHDTLVGYQEVGGSARLAGTPAPAHTASTSTAPQANAPAKAAQSLVEGIVYDSTSGRPLEGVEVSVGGGRFKTTTDAGGRYALPLDGAVSDKIIFDHQRLRLLHVAERVQNLSVPSGGRAQVSVIVPSYATLRRTLCAQNETGTESEGIAVGRVRDANGNPIFNAHVWASWQVQWINQNGKLVATNQQRTAETDTGPDGSYMMCGFTRGAQITLKSSMAGKGVAEERVTMPPTLVLEHDIVLARK